MNGKDESWNRYDSSSADETFLGFDDEEEEFKVRKSNRVKQKKEIFTYHKIGGTPLLE